MPLRDVKFYTNYRYKRYLIHKISKQYTCDTDVKKVSHGIIVNEHVHGFGVFDDKWNFIKSSTQIRGKNGNFVPKISHKNIQYEDKDVVFLGNVYPAFGHFLLEHMNRAWALLDKKYQNMYYVLVNNQDVNPVPKYMYDLLKFVGIPREKIIILNKTTQFRNVFIPTQAFNIALYSCDKFAKTFDLIAKNAKTCSKTKVFDKIYVSRDAMKTRRTYGEKYISKIFEKNGFKVIYPEKLPLAEQICLISQCRVLAGCAGTALHLALFMKPGGGVIQIKRNKKNKDNAATQYLINKIKKLNSVFISASIEKKPTKHGSNIPQIIGLNKYMRKFFDDNCFVYDKCAPVLNEKIKKEYKKVLFEYVKTNGNAYVEQIKDFLIRFSSCFIPGRERRGAYRRWLKKFLKYKK